MSDAEPKSPEQVLSEYLESDSPEEWLVNEVCGYLFDAVPDGELEERLNGFDDMISAERDRMLEEGPELDDVVLYTITVEHVGEGPDDVEDEFLSFRGCPSPALLLEACTHMADPGELVRVDMVYGDASHSTATLLWPFPMHVAVEVTTATRREMDENDLAFMDFVQAHSLDEGPVGGRGDDDEDDAEDHGTGEGRTPSASGPAATPVLSPADVPVPDDGFTLGLAVGTAAGVLAGLMAARHLLTGLRPRR